MVSFFSRIRSKVSSAASKVKSVVSNAVKRGRESAAARKRKTTTSSSSKQTSASTGKQTSAPSPKSSTSSSSSSSSRSSRSKVNVPAPISSGPNRNFSRAVQTPAPTSTSNTRTIPAPVQNASNVVKTVDKRGVTTFTDTSTGKKFGFDPTKPRTVSTSPSGVFFQSGQGTITDVKSGKTLRAGEGVVNLGGGSRVGGTSQRIRSNQFGSSTQSPNLTSSKSDQAFFTLGVGLNQPAPKKVNVPAPISSGPNQNFSQERNLSLAPAAGSQSAINFTPVVATSAFQTARPTGFTTPLQTSPLFSSGSVQTFQTPTTKPTPSEKSNLFKRLLNPPPILPSTFAEERIDTAIPQEAISN